MHATHTTTITPHHRLAIIATSNSRQYLQEYRRSLRILVVGSADASARTLRELVPERAPLLVHQRAEASQRAVLWIQHHLRQRRQLRRAIPAVTAVHQHTDAAAKEIRNSDSAGKNN